MGETGAPHSLSWPHILVAAAVSIVIAATAWLWAHYGAAVFFETIRAGFIACFG
jgi:hypothetical protein